MVDELPDIYVPGLDVGHNFSALVRGAMAANLANPAAVEGAAVAGAITTGLAPTAATLATLPTTYQLRPMGSGFLAFGDSISTAEEMSAGGAGYGAAWPQMACALSDQRLNFRGNAGVTGETSTQIRARISSALAFSPSVVTILAGTNNITASGSDLAPAFATFKDDIRAICAALRAAGVRVVLCTIPPRSGAMYTSTRLATTMKWNSWLREYARNGAEFPADRGGFELVDFFALLADPTNGQYKSGYDSGDGLHPSQVAHLAMAQLVASKVSTYSYAPIKATIDAGDPYNLLAHPLLAAGSPTPTSWITSGSASADWTEGLVTDSDFRGSAWQVAFTSAASASNFREFKSFAVSTGFAVGDKILVSFRTKVTASTGVIPSTTAGLRGRLLFTGGTPTTFTPVGGLSVVSPSALHWFRSTVPAGTTSLQMSFLNGTIPIGANFTALVGEVGMFNLTAMGLA